MYDFTKEEAKAFFKKEFQGEFMSDLLGEMVTELLFSDTIKEQVNENEEAQYAIDLVNSCMKGETNMEILIKNELEATGMTIKDYVNDYISIMYGC